MIALTALLLWLSLRGLTLGEGENRTDFLWQAWQNANKGYLGLMAVVAILSHLLRAERWRMLLMPTGNKVGLTNSFLSLGKPAMLVKYHSLVALLLINK